MQDSNIMSVHSDLIGQFKIRTRTETAIEKIRILFYFEGDGFDLVADEEETGCCMVVASYSKRQRRWRHKLLPGSPGRRYIQDVCQKVEVESVPMELNMRLDLFRV